MTLYRRRLPHVYETHHPVLLTWRLYGSLPANRHFPGGSLSSGQAFTALDRLLDEARTGPLYLSQPALADLVVEAIHFNAQVLAHYVLHAFAVMPNHVHVSPVSRPLMGTQGVALPPWLTGWSISRFAKQNAR
jgi:hypothetical protein